MRLFSKLLLLAALLFTLCLSRMSFGGQGQIITCSSNNAFYKQQEKAWAAVVAKISELLEE